MLNIKVLDKLRMHLSNFSLRCIKNSGAKFVTPKQSSYIYLPNLKNEHLMDKAKCSSLWTQDFTLTLLKYDVHYVNIVR